MHLLASVAIAVAAAAALWMHAEAAGVATAATTNAANRNKTSATETGVTLAAGNAPIQAPISSAVAPAQPAAAAAVVAPVPAVVATTTRRPLLQGIRLPCQCAHRHCGCCSGMILASFQQKACMNLTYDADETAVTASLSMNERVLYKNTFSGRNPDPMCIRVPRFRFIEFCVEFSNIYFAQRNIHMCIDAEASWSDFSLVEWSFDCIRLGAGGVAVIGPEEGGGLPAGGGGSGGSGGGDDDDDIEDYDENVRSATLLPRNTSSSSSSSSRKYTVEKLPNGFVKIDFNEL